MNACKRICMWSGPRNISTTMMRSFENRADCTVIDEPFYAHFLHATGIDHPMRDEVLAAQPTDWRRVRDHLCGPCPTPVFFQKHMTHHITASMETDWLAKMDHFFLIRDPARIIASYAEKTDDSASVLTSLKMEVVLFEEITRLTGSSPPVVDAQDMLADPQGMLRALCAHLEIPFDDAMLTWPAGLRDSDGVWAPHWYHAVESSTGFRPPADKQITLSAEQQQNADACQPHYATLYEQRLLSR